MEKKEIWYYNHATYSTIDKNGEQSLSTQGWDICKGDWRKPYMICNIIPKNDNPELIERKEHHEVNTHENYEQSEANAKLICEAVNNYDKLKEDNALLLDNLKRLIDRMEENDLGQMHSVKRAKEAIQKVENK